MRKRKQMNQTQTVSVRLNNAEYIRLQEEVQKRNSNASQILKEALNAYNTEHDLGLHLRQLEGRIFRRIFEIHCAVDRLSDLERSEVLKNINQRLKGGL